MKRHKAVVFGAGGHSKVLLEIILEDPSVEVVGLLDSNQEKWGLAVLGVEVLGGDNLAEQLMKSGVDAFYLGLGSTGNLAPRKRIFDNAVEIGLKPLSALHNKAIISKHVRIRPGSCVMAGAVINAGALVGRNVCVNTAAVIEHDCILESHCFIGPGVRMGGAVRVGSTAFVGIGSTVRHGLTLGAGCLVGAGAVVVKDVLKRQVVVGVPARPMVAR